MNFIAEIAINFSLCGMRYAGQQRRRYIVLTTPHLPAYRLIKIILNPKPILSPVAILNKRPSEVTGNKTASSNLAEGREACSRYVLIIG